MSTGTDDRPATRPRLERLKNAPAVERAVTFLHGSVGAYLGVGTDFQSQTAGTRIAPHSLGGYYCDFTHKADPSQYAPGAWLAVVLDGGPWESPMMVAQSALGFWERMLDGEPDADERFLACADWLLRNGDDDGRHGLEWRHGMPVPKYELAPDWLSGMTQGEAISVLLRAHALSGEERFLDGALRAFGPFRADVRDGGVTREIDGALVLEEYPTTAPTAVLNGWIFGLLGLHELRIASGEREVEELFQRTWSGLLQLLPRYDIGWWSLYSLRDHGRPDLAKPFYQRLHPVLVDGVDLAQHDPRLGETARRWEDQLTTPAMVRIAFNKSLFRIYRQLPRTTR